MAVEEMLADLRTGWYITLTDSPDGWHLTIVNRAPRVSSFGYTGTDLHRVVSAAWAGEPSGRV